MTPSLRSSKVELMTSWQICRSTMCKRSGYIPHACPSNPKTIVRFTGLIFWGIKIIKGLNSKQVYQPMDLDQVSPRRKARNCAHRCLSVSPYPFIRILNQPVLNKHPNQKHSELKICLLGILWWKHLYAQQLRCLVQKSSVSR